jgi:hypothetical protein
VVDEVDPWWRGVFVQLQRGHGKIHKSQAGNPYIEKKISADQHQHSALQQNHTMVTA